MEGLVIDDYFALAVSEQGKASLPTKDVECFETAKKAYDDKGLWGSSSKDIIGQPCAKVVGAQMNASARAIDRSLVSIGSPPCKCFGLSWIALLLCQLPFTTYACSELGSPFSCAGGL